MKVYLLKDVPKVGKAGEIVDVSDGFARNYLIKNGLAEVATDSLIKRLESEKRLLKSKIEHQKSKAEEIKKKIESLPELIFEKSSSKEGKIFGSVSSIEVMEELKKRGIHVEKQMIQMEHIKDIGIHNVKIKLFPGIEANLKIKILPKEIATH
ncbi:MAG: 50S ribosomal protein L9 [bacterium]|nr:50S ribosomal protein L9 [bacterium]